jgi:hypothetical protein
MSAAPSPSRIRAARHFEFARPLLEVITPEAVIISWMPPKPLQPAADLLPEASTAAPENSTGSPAARSPGALGSSAPPSHSVLPGTPFAAPATPSLPPSTPVGGSEQSTMLRRFYVEWKPASAPDFATAETPYCHVVIPMDRWGETLTIRVSFRQAPMITTLHAAAEVIMRSDFYVGEYTSFTIQRPPTPHGLLLPTPRLDPTEDQFAPPGTVVAAIPAAETSLETTLIPLATHATMPGSFLCHPLVFLALGACTGRSSDPTAATRAALREFGASPDSTMDTIQCLGFDAVGNTKLAALEIDLTAPALTSTSLFTEHNAQVLFGATRAILLVSSSGVDHSSPHNNKNVSPGRNDLRIEIALVSEWLADDRTVVVLCGFGGHGEEAVTVAYSLNRLIRNPTKYNTAKFSEKLMSDAARKQASKRIMAVTFCTTMDHFMVTATNHPIMATAADCSARCLHVLPRNDGQDPVHGFSAKSLPGTSSALNANATNADPFDRVKGKRFPLALADADLGVPVEFVVDCSANSRCAVVLGHGTTLRSPDDEGTGLEVTPRNTALIGYMKAALLGSTRVCSMGEALELLAPRIDHAVIRTGKGVECAIDVKGVGLDSVRAVTLFFDASAPGLAAADEHHIARHITHDLLLTEGRFECDRLTVPVHPACLIQFIPPSRAASGVCLIGVFVATDAGSVLYAGITYAMPATLTPFLLSNRLAAANGDEAFSESAHDALTSMLRIEALSLIAPFNSPMERPARILTAVDRCAAAVEQVKGKLGSGSVKSVFARVMQTAAAKISNDPLLMKDLIAVPAAISSHDAVRKDLQSMAPQAGGKASGGLEDPAA